MQVFIASVNEEGRSPDDERYLELRAGIQALRFDGVTPWIAEFAAPGLYHDGWRAIVDSCVGALHRSDLMVVLLYRRHGTAIEIDALGPSPVSHFEIELFHACLRRIPVLFFRAEDFDPDPKLLAVLMLLERIMPPQCWIRCAERDLAGQVIETLQAISNDGRLPDRIAGFCDALSDKRSFQRVDREIMSTELSFLRDFTPGGSGDVSIARADLLLHETEALAGTGEGSYVGRLSRLWLVLRELSQQPINALDSEIAGRWLRLCELWTSTAAWLHLHGPLELGVLATLHTRVDLRQAGFLPDRIFPYGAFASEAYSIAKVSETIGWQKRRFHAARTLATQQIANAAEDPSGAYGIRASATMQMAQRGAPWMAAAGLWDYRKMVRSRERAGASPSLLGEAYVELGFAEFAIGRALPWLRRAGLDRMREGLEMLLADHPELRAGFVKRAQLKLAEALAIGGLHDEAQAQRVALEAFAKAQGLPQDQRG
jgi:hypothetical protein